MKLSTQCHKCLEGLVRQTVELATPDVEQREIAMAEGLMTLNKLYSFETTAPEVATEIHRVIRRLTGNPDPYRKVKDREIKMSKRIFKEIRPFYGEDFRSLVKMAALGNTIDFFKDQNMVIEEMRKSLEFTIDCVDELEKKVKCAKRIIYLADNAGECFFDLPLLNWMRKSTRVTYVVKGSQVQNDITLEDLRKAGLIKEFGELMTTGTDCVGVDFSKVSDEFNNEFKSADLIFAKGMGNYETLSELKDCKKIAYCLMAKCQPIAESLDVPLHSYITMV